MTRHRGWPRYESDIKFNTGRFPPAMSTRPRPDVQFCAATNRKTKNMNMQKRVLITAAALAAVGAGVAPTAAATPPAPEVPYTAAVDGDAAVITVGDTGTLVAEDGHFQIRTASDQVLAGLPLKLHVGDFAFPIDVAVSGHTARLTPRLDPAYARYEPIAEPVAQPSAERLKDALDRAMSSITKRIGISAAVGAAAGGVIGCLLGGATGAVATAPLAMLFGAGPLVGCAIGAAAFVPGGAVTGALSFAAPVVIPAFLQYLITVNT
ncbi:hypothetical protein [Nocardia sp. NPDC047654]|uniref:hypothetical protein n=1 Tax=Nocardia sp. NPDC047654 TaxID=3364314 RepID=UPI00371C2926